jgi:uncharacterized membrane protein YeaQ/YmgE (transglycosylase-associated protein family)
MLFHSVHPILFWIIVGGVAGWLAGLVVRGGGFGLLGDILVGIIGAIVAGYLFPVLHVRLAVGVLGSIVDAAIGAIVLLLLVRLVRRA